MADYNTGVALYKCEFIRRFQCDICGKVEHTSTGFLLAGQEFEINARPLGWDSPHPQITVCKAHRITPLCMVDDILGRFEFEGGGWKWIPGVHVNIANPRLVAKILGTFDAEPKRSPTDHHD